MVGALVAVVGTAMVPVLMAWIPLLVGMAAVYCGFKLQR